MRKTQCCYSFVTSDTGSMKMKHLWILVLAVVCASVKADSIVSDITKYDLELEDKSDYFIGTLTLTPKTTITKTLVLDIGSDLELSDCTYDTNKKCKITPLENGKVEIGMTDGSGEKIIVKYKGEYAPNGLFKEKIANKDYYFASFANGGIVNILPCNKDDVADFEVKFKTASVTEKPESNIESLGSSNVRLQDIVFVYGPFTEVKSGGPVNQVVLKGVADYGANTLKAKKFSNDVLKKMDEILGTTEFSNAKPMQQYLFPRLTVREINGKYFSTQSLKNYLLSDNIGAVREQSIRTDLIRRLTQHWFDAGRTTDKWLNAGLSAFLAYYALDKWPTSDTEKKKFRALDQLVVDQLQLRAFEADGFASSLPLKDFNTRATTYDGVLSDPILYAKGVSIMRSVMAICGKEKFEKVLKEYVKKSDPIGVKDFAKIFKDCFPAGAVENVEKFFQKWHELPGYPVVHVNRTNSGLALAQEKFGWAGGSEAGPWNLSLTYKTQTGEDGLFWMTDKKTNIDKLPEAKFDWIIFNVNSNGYYRVNYDMKTWDAIITQLEKNHTAIGEINRAQIIDDIFSFARSVGNFSMPVPDYKMAVKLFEYLKKEKDYIPLKAAFNAIEFLDSALKGTEPLSMFRARVKGFVEEAYKTNNLTSNSTDHVKNLLRKEIGNWACKLGVQDCVKASEEYYLNITSFKEFQQQPDVEEIIYCTIAANDKLSWFQMFQQLLLQPSCELDLTLISALGCSGETNAVERFLESSYEHPKLQNYQLEIISSVLNGNPGNVNTTIGFLNEKIKKPAKPTVEYFEKVVQLILRKLNNSTRTAFLSFVKAALPDGNRIRSEAETVTTIMKTWEEKKIALITESLTSGENRTKPIAFFVTLTAILPFIRYFLRY